MRENGERVTEGIQHIGRFLIVLGVVIAAVGALLSLSDKVPWLGRLPGDIFIHKRNFTFYFPLATSIVISIVLTFLFWIFGRR
jgi:hypothetical protein